MGGTRTEARSISELLKSVPIFTGCSQRDIKNIAASGKVVHQPMGQAICKEGESGVGLHVILEGEVRVEVGGRVRRRLGPGSFFGEIALLDGGPRTATVIAETPVTAFAIAVWSFRSMLKAHPTIAIKILEEVCRRVRSNELRATRLTA